LVLYSIQNFGGFETTESGNFYIPQMGDGRPPAREKKRRGIVGRGILFYLFDKFPPGNRRAARLFIAVSHFVVAKFF
jgi:hypothetical protein